METNTYIISLLMSQSLQWIMIIILTIIVLMLVRQIGILHERITPIGALVSDHGPKIGEIGPIFNLHDIKGMSIIIGGDRDNDELLFLFFASTECPICKKLIPLIKSISKQELFNVIYIFDGNMEEINKVTTKIDFSDEIVVNSSGIGIAYGIAKLPYAAIMDNKGVIRAKGLINNREQIESLLEAIRLGYSSIQEYQTDKLNDDYNKVGNQSRSPLTRRE